MPSEFAVVFTESAGPTALERLKQNYPAAYELVPKTAYLIKDIGLTADIAVKIGFKSEPRVAQGVVFKLNHAYSGFTDRTLWEWLGE